MRPMPGGSRSGRTSRWSRGRTRAVGARLLLLLCVVTACTWAGIGSASAHGGGSPNVYAVVDSVSPSLPGSVDVSVKNGSFTLLSVRNRTDKYLDVLDPAGEPFVRVGPRGTFGNLNSAQWYLSSSPEGAGDIPESAQRESSPRWGQVSDVPRWAWFDSRLTTRPSHQHERVKIGGRWVTKLGDWSLHLRYGGKDVTVEGHLEYRPLPGTLMPHLTSPSEVAPGVSVSLLPGTVPGVFLSNTSSRTVLVRGRLGEPFVRIGPDGTQVNVHSATYADDRRTRGLSSTSKVNANRPSWVRASNTPSYTWLDSRANYTNRQLPKGALTGGHAVTAGSWRIPLEIGGRSHPVKGVTVWKPSAQMVAAARARSADQDDLGFPAIMGVSILPVLLVGAGAVVRRRLRADRAE